MFDVRDDVQSVGQVPWMGQEPDAEGMDFELLWKGFEYFAMMTGWLYIIPLITWLLMAYF